MLKRGERALVGAAVGAIAVAAILGTVLAPASSLTDRRLSTYLAGPYGAKGLGQTLAHLGAEVVRWRKPYYMLPDSAHPDTTRLLAFLDVSLPRTGLETATIRGYVANGGRVFIAGVEGIDACFGFKTRFVRDNASGALRNPDVRHLYAARRVLEPVSPESLARAHPVRPGGERACVPRPATRVDTLLVTNAGELVAVRIRWPGSGTATLLADEHFLTNRSLKETDAGIVVIPWILSGGIRKVVFDEYHLGFETGGSLVSVSWDWLLDHPLGWAILQGVGVAILALAVQAVRFGPVRWRRERRRRSALEHVDALAAGLERSHGEDVAIQMMISGLRRRLSPAGRSNTDSAREWIERLEDAMVKPEGRAAAHRLLTAMMAPDIPDRLLMVATSVEEVWEELRPPTTRKPF